MALDADDIESLNYRLDVSILYMSTGIVNALCYGAASITFGLALSHLWQRLTSSSSTQPRAVQVLFFIISLQWTLDTLEFIAAITAYITQLQGYHLFSTSMSLSDQYTANAWSGRAAMLILGNIAGTLVIPMGNAIVIWRAWVLYSTEIFPRILLAFIWGVDCIFNLTQLGIYISMKVHPDTLDSALINRMTSIESFLTLAVNAVATSMIAWRAWTHHLALRESKLVKKSSAAAPVLYNLVEWGGTLFVTQLLIAVMAYIYVSGDPSNPGRIAKSAVSAALHIFSDVHPALIVLVLAKGRSVIENEILSAGSIVRHPDNGAEPGTVGTFKARRGPQAQHRLSTMQFVNSESESPEGFDLDSQREYSEDLTDSTASVGDFEKRSKRKLTSADEVV